MTKHFFGNQLIYLWQTVSEKLGSIRRSQDKAACFVLPTLVTASVPIRMHELMITLHRASTYFLWSVCKGIFFLFHQFQPQSTAHKALYQLNLYGI